MEHEKFEGERTLMRIHIGESDKWHGRALYEALVELFRKEGLSGATVLRGVAGYGSMPGSGLPSLSSIFSFFGPVPGTSTPRSSRIFLAAVF